APTPLATSAEARGRCAPAPAALPRVRSFGSSSHVWICELEPKLRTRHQGRRSICQVAIAARPLGLPWRDGACGDDGAASADRYGRTGPRLDPRCAAGRHRDTDLDRVVLRSSRTHT